MQEEAKFTTEVVVVAEVQNTANNEEMIAEPINNEFSNNTAQ